jgi:Mn2+/Fe2+ NRAMP family transporter
VIRQGLQILLGVLTAIGGYAEVTSISTGAQAGAEFGLRLLWPLVLGTVGLVLLIEMVGRWAAVAQESYAGAIREHFGFGFYLVPLCAEVIADILLLAAELGGMATGLAMLTGLPLRLAFLPCAVAVWAAVWFLKFSQIEQGPAVLGLLALAFVVAIGLALARPGAVVPLASLIHPFTVPGGQAGQYLFLVSAVLGATISPYLVVFYASGAREEGWNRRSLLLNRVTAVVGIGFGGVIGVAIIVLSSIIFGPSHSDVATLPIASQLLSNPLGGLGRILFAAILLITCFGAACEVSLAVSFDLCQGMGWAWDQSAPHALAVRFRWVLLVVLVLGTTVGVIAGDPLSVALIASVVMALVLPASLGPFLVLMNDRRRLGDQANGLFTNVALVSIWAVAVLVSLSTIPLLIVSGGGGG